MKGGPCVNVHSQKGRTEEEGLAVTPEWQRGHREQARQLPARSAGCQSTYLPSFCPSKDRIAENTAIPWRYCGFCSRPPQESKNHNKSCHHLFGGGGSCLKFVKKTSVKHDKMSEAQLDKVGLCKKAEEAVRSEAQNLGCTWESPGSFEKWNAQAAPRTRFSSVFSRLNVYAKLRTAALGKPPIVPLRGMLGAVYPWILLFFLKLLSAATDNKAVSPHTVAVLC